MGAKMTLLIKSAWSNLTKWREKPWM